MDADSALIPRPPLTHLMGPTHEMLGRVGGVEQRSDGSMAALEVCINPVEGVLADTR